MNDDNKNTQNKEHVLNEMNDYISSTMSIPVIKLDDNGEMIKPEETKVEEEAVQEIYATTVSEEESDMGRDIPTPLEDPVAETTPVVEEEAPESAVAPEVIDAMSAMNANEQHEQANLEVKEVPKKKGKGKGILITCVVLVALGLLGYFVVYPFIQSKFMSNPKNVFSVTIKDTAKNVNSLVDRVPLTNALYDINVKVDTSIAELKDYSGYTFGIKAGIDTENKALETSAYMKNGENNYELATYLRDNKSYLKVSSYDGIINLGENNSVEISEIFKSYEESIGNINSSSNDIQHLITKVGDLFVDSIDESKLSSSKTSITISGKKVDVEKNTYVIDNDNYYRTIEFIIDGIEKDEIARDTFEDLMEVKISELKEQFKDKSNLPQMDTIKINIYTAGRKKDVVGYDIEVKDQVLFSYYFDNNGWEVKLTGAYASVGEQTASADLVITGVKNGDKTNVKITADGKDIATMEVSQWDEKGIDLTYVINIDENQQVNGSFRMKVSKGDDFNNTNMVLVLISGSDKISIEANVDVSYKAKIADIDTASAVTLNEEDLNAVLNNFVGSLNNTPIGALLGTMNGMYRNDADAALEQYYQNNPSADPFSQEYLVG